jgi:DNA helicase-2/ATP-dependent DNA helicase PcrA
MTLHMAKGLEFPAVFITGMEDGLLPLLRVSDAFDADTAAEEAKAVEEERRLVYVGMTRAKEKLYLSRAQYRRRYGKPDITVPSRFLNEIPEKLLVVQDRTRSAFLRPVQQSGRLSDNDKAFAAFEREVGEVFGEEQPAVPPRHGRTRRDAALQEVVGRMLDTSDTQVEAEELEVGDRVRHAQFGIGTVEALTGRGLSRKARVHFRQHGPKLLLLSLAKLEKV